MCWYLRGTNRLDIISYYSRRYRQFSDDGMTLYGAYGRRLFTNELTGSVQWQAALRCLQRDPDTRQAVLHLHLPQDLLADTKDVPCTCYLQFFIRENRLEMIVNMRSNDIIWGTAYDVFSFTMMQEIMARQLRLEVGPYMHFAGSMHIYDRHLQMAEEILSERPYRTFEMPRMPEDPWKGLHELLRTEEELRTSGVACSWPEDEYWHQLAIVLQIYAVTKSGHEAHTLSLRPKLMGCYESLLFRGDALVRREGGTPL